MAENKTKPTTASVEEYLAAIVDESRRKDCQDLAKLMTKISKQKPKMWGTSIVGFGSYHYKYESGREGDSCLVGFSSRKGDISLYLRASSAAQAKLLAKLGRHKKGGGCLYIRKLADVDSKVLEQMVAQSIIEVKQLYP
jgi:hypothetical protein